MYIHGIGHFHPPNIIDNNFLESLNIGTNNEWILSRVGIKERRTVLDLNYIKDTFNSDIKNSFKHCQYTSQQTACLAAEKALKQAKINASDIGMVIAGGCAAEYLLPASACIFASELGITAPCFDVTSACSTFAAQLHFLANLETKSTPDYILMIQAENWTKTIDYKDRTSAVLVGDGTTAAIVSKKHPGWLKVLNTTFTSDPSGWQKVQTPQLGYFLQDGRAVHKFAIQKTIKTYETLTTQLSSPPKTHYFISHQANLTMLETVCSKLNINQKQHLFNIDYFGNTASAGAPSVLSQNKDKFTKGSHITLVVVGAGLSWGGASLEVNNT